MFRMMRWKWFLGGMLLVVSNFVDAQGIDVTGTVTATTISATNLTGTIQTASQPNITTIGTLGALTVTGNITGATISGTISTASQANITRVGTLSGLTVAGGITSLNDNSNFTTTINTGSSTGLVDIGGTAAQTINIGSGASGVKTINIGTGAVANQIILGNAATAGNEVGVHVAAPTAKLHIGPGTTAVAPFKLSTGTSLTTAESGAIEYDGNAFYGTPATTNPSRG
ncbi:MAG: hypothetical protein RLZZ28_261, partial [Bacteroidota bacterium]